MSQVQDLVSRLKELLNSIKEYELAEQENIYAEKSLSLHSPLPSHLKDFDDSHMESFIAEKIGTRPVEPNGIIKLLVPLYLIQKSQFDAANATYEKMRPLAEAAYRETYQSERDNLRAQDKKESDEIISAAKNRISATKESLMQAKERLAANTTLSDSLKHSYIVNKLISYLEEGRADDLKEAVNLYYDEKRKDEETRKAEAHRKEMLSLEKEKVRAAKAAEEYQRLQYEEAQEAAFYAQQAAEAAQDADDTAKSIQFDQL